jgi:glutaredoxin
MKDVVVYYSPSCAFSAGTVSFLVSQGADVRLINIDEADDERHRLKQRLGGKRLATPTLEIDGKLLVAPSLSDLKDKLEEDGAFERPHMQ